MPIYRKGQNPEDSGYTLATVVFEIGVAGVDWRVYTDSIREVEHRGRVTLN